ncbi:MAG: hypothetical protein H0W16_09310 [Actinobacteria bacterium]|nr:hypothetical protein [Actinomycetota bacterium]
MYVSVTRTKDPLDQSIELATIAGEEMVPWLRQIDGFEGLLMLSNETEGATLVLSFWESREVAEAHRVARMQFRDRITSALSVEVVETTGFEVSFAQLGPRIAALR